MGVEYSPAPYFNLDEEFTVQQIIKEGIQKKLFQSAHDVSEGGLITTLLESAMNRNVGFEVSQQNQTIRIDAYWFGEGQGRIVVSIKPSSENDFISFINHHNISIEKLGTVSAKSIIVNSENWGTIEDWKNKYDTSIENILQQNG